MKKLKTKEEVVEYLYKVFTGWDIYEMFEVMCKQINDIANVVSEEDFPDRGMLINDSNILLETIQKGKENRLKITNEIRNLWKTGEYTPEQLSELFNSTEDSICSIVTNKTLYDEDYQKWIEKSDEFSSYYDKDGHWKIEKKKRWFKW